jgi:predicted O-methyltransferase YrrM
MITWPIFFRVERYIKYLLVSQNRKGHGIHSPFVFDLVTRVLRNKLDPPVVFRIEELRRKMKHDSRTVNMTDFGSGGNSHSTKVKKVSDIIRKSAVPARYGKLLSRMAGEFGGGVMLEFGTSLGISTMYLASGRQSAQVITMEGCPDVAEMAAENFKEAGIENIRIVTGSFDDTLPVVMEMGISPGLVFIDGNHRKKPVIEYFEKVLQFASHDSVIIIDDINHSGEMAEAWEEIKNNPASSLTVDIFRMGMVFPGKGIGRNNYVVMY